MQLLKAIKVLFSEKETEDQKIEKEYWDFNTHWAAFQFGACTENPKTRSKWLPVLFVLTKRLDENHDDYRCWLFKHYPDMFGEYYRCMEEINSMEQKELKLCRRNDLRLAL